MRYPIPVTDGTRPAAVSRRAATRVQRGLIAAALACGGLIPAGTAAQEPAPSAEADGLVHVSLALEAQEIRVAYNPDLDAGDPAHRDLLAGAVGSRLRIGTFEAHRALRIGSLAPDLAALEAAAAAAAAPAAADGEPGEAAAEPTEDAEPAPEPPDPELWLVRDAAGWQLEVLAAGDEGAGETQTVPLAHRRVDGAAPRLTASIHAAGAEEGRLALRWGEHAWSADFRFEELPPRPPRPRVSGRGQSRAAEDDNTATARGNMLSERNATTLVLPNGASLEVLYWKSVDIDDEDYPTLAAVAEGAVVEMIRSAVLRLKADVALRFGRADVPTGNLAPGFAGAYGIWLRRTGDGWRFVFTDEPDSWGTQYDPAFDAAEIDVDYSRGQGAFRPLGATLVPAGVDRGRLIVHWGPHEWAADFAIPSLTGPPRTAWGDPDLQGIWNNSTTTPLERLTEAERDRGQVARAPVIAATRGTGAAWPETGGLLEQPSLIIDPPDGRIVLTPTAVERLVARERARDGRGEADTWLDRNSWERCISRTLPVMMIPNLYNNNYQILQTPDHVAILVEMIHETRIIPLDGGPHVADGIRQWLGNSRGHWEGDTLVVETLGFHDRLDGGDYQPSHILQTGHRGSGATLRLVERFTRVDAETIDYRFTVEDPATYERPYTAAIPMRRRENQDPIYEYACHEGNYGMLNLLRGGRADEQLALDAAGLVSRQRIEGGHPGVREPAVPFAEPR